MADLELGLVVSGGSSSASSGFSARADQSNNSGRLSLGEKVVAVVLIAPTLLNWLVLAEAHFIGTAEFGGSDGVSHAVHRSRSDNFEQTFFLASTTCIASVFAHVWLTMGAIARLHKLDQAGAVGGEGYASRLERAEAEAKKLSAAEWAHLAMVAVDFFFAAFVVFSQDRAVGILPGAGVALVARCVLAPARAAVLRTQRTDGVAFAGSALRGSMAALMVQVLVLARCVRVLHASPFSVHSLAGAAQVRGLRGRLSGGPVYQGLRFSTRHGRRDQRHLGTRSPYFYVLC